MPQENNDFFSITRLDANLELLEQEANKNPNKEGALWMAAVIKAARIKTKTKLSN